MRGTLYDASALVGTDGGVNRETGPARVLVVAGVAGPDAVRGGEVPPTPAQVLRLAPPETFESFYRRELVGVAALARALCGPAHADDVAQEAMLVAYRRWDEVQHHERPGAWVRRVAVNLATSTLRRRAVEARALLRLGARPSVVVELAPSADAFWAEVRRLPRRQAQVVALHYLEDLSVADVAATLGCAEGTVKQHLSRARVALAAALAGWRDQGEETA